VNSKGKDPGGGFFMVDFCSQGDPVERRKVGKSTLKVRDFFLGFSTSGAEKGIGGEGEVYKN